MTKNTFFTMFLYVYNTTFTTKTMVNKQLTIESFQKYKVESRRALKSEILVTYVKLLWF